MPAERTIPYQPALDGVRALAVIAVLLFHGGVSWMTGGYLGVSVFFTLSGYLITSLLVRETHRSGRVDAGRFYARRARRLLPASLVCLAAVCVLASTGAFQGVSGLRRDVLGALLQVFNWVKLNSGESYADLTTAASGLRHPLDHYWSLSIEEQFYWVWPVAVLGLVRLGRRWPRWTLLRAVGVLYVLSAVAAPVIAWVWGPDAAYWATPARASEILAGALLACWWSVRPAERSTPAALGWLAVPCLVALGVTCVTFPAGSGLAYRGALPLIGLLSAGLILGLQADGPLRRVLSWRPLVAVGLVSYGLYLYHWPVFVLVDRQRWDLPFSALLGVKVAITTAITLLSYVVVERPIRLATRWPARRTLALGGLAMAVVGALVVIVPQPTKFYAVDTADAAQVAIDTAPVAPLVPSDGSPTTASPARPPVTSPVVVPPPSIVEATTTGPPTTSTATPPAPTAAPAAPTTTVAVVPPRPVRILVIGDSTAEATGNGLVAWAKANPVMAQVSLEVREGCGFVLGGYVTGLGLPDRDVDKFCERWLTRDVPNAVARLKPDAVVLLTTSWDTLDRKLVAHTDQALPVDDPQVAPVVQAALADITATVLAEGASRAVWIRQPIADPEWFHMTGGQRDPANHQVLYDEMAELAAANPAVRVVDLAGWVESNGLATDEAARPDGVHWTPATAEEIAAGFLGPAIVRASLT